ncbi:DegT/DnrJ/EryC1/StrS family aminotransferase [Rathayibacter soli]|uniref:DegT/DnrJ/EryC1/StrS family aminotransferase n=1 Tax=Rathayibacter soli TaxID=3144168 RepID=UPI0027E5025E|nr:DegT/DnrJ/EryC1/StrS family aminotransferase [Glaciibacter superstes]
MIAKTGVTPLVAKTAQRVEQFRRPTFFYESAREGMRDLLANVLDHADDGVLLPAYIGWSRREGSGVFDPIVNSGARFAFYDLNADLSANIDDLERRLVADQCRVIVLIHYFGRTDPNLAVIRTIADRHGAILVEDLAHGFFSAYGTGQAGSYGHASLFSLHKMFPFAEGGMVSYLDQKLVRGQRESRPDLAIRILGYDWRAIAHARRENYLHLASLLQKLPGYGTRFKLLWPSLRECDVPQTLPVVVTGDSRDSIYSNMNADGFGMVSLYHTLIEPVRANFQALNDLARHIINFPVHQDVVLSELSPMAAAFQRHVSGSDVVVNNRSDVS